MNPLYMFGSGGNDPDTQTENIGDDPIKASEYGLKNLKVVAEKKPAAKKAAPKKAAAKKAEDK